jgi:putative ABC transport system permease protein
MQRFIGDLRFGLRMLAKTPGFTLVAAVTLGLGITASTIVFGWIHTVLLHPIPGVYRAHELVALEGIAPDGNRLGARTHPDFRAFQQGLTGASGVVASHTSFFTVGSSEHATRVLGEVVSANFFVVLGVKPFLGRLFLPQEDRDTPGAFPIAVISHRLWTTQFGADRGVVGRAIRINGHPLTLVGVTPPDFRGTFSGAAFDVWVPLSMILDMGALNTWAADDWNAQFLNVIVRLKSGVTVQQAREEARVVAARIAADHPDTHRGISARMVPLWRSSNGMQATLRDPLYLLAVVCILVLLIVCANVANLLMARGITRQREFGVRMAMGATRGRIVRQLLAEVMLLAGAGVWLGVLLASWLGDSLYRVLPSLEPSIRATLEPLLHVKLSIPILAFAILISLGTALLSTVLPALAVGRVDVNHILKEGGRGGPGGQSHRARAMLVILEVALAALALCGAGLAVRSFQKIAALNPGFDTQNVYVAHLHLSTNGYSLAQEKQFCRDLCLRLESAPGIQQVTYADSVPLSLYAQGSDRVGVEGFDQDQGGIISIPRSIVAPGYFRLLKVPMLAGRDFTDKDDEKGLRVIIVNQTFARKFFGGKNPIGQRVRVSDDWTTVVGMVQDSKYRSPAEAPMPFFYGPFRQIYYSGYTPFFYLRTNGDPAVARAALRREIAGLALTSGIYDSAPMTEYIQGGLFAERIVAGLLSFLGSLALALAAVGLYSVMSYAVSERTHEFGIRRALGAQRGQALFQILREGFLLTLPGLVAGVAAAVAGSRVVSSKLNLPMNWAEPSVFGLAALVLAGAALLASFVPGWRAVKADPMAALRHE